MTEAEKFEKLPAEYRADLLVQESGMFFNVAMFEQGQRIAQMFAESTMVPDHFKKNIGNCMIAINYAHRVGADPFMTMQNMYVVKGKPGVEAKFAIAVFNASGKWKPMKFRYNKERTSCQARSVEIASEEVCEGVEVTIQMAKDEGWYAKPGSKWKTLPELMLMYRSAMFFVRAYAPEVLLGMQSKEELYDTLEMKKGADGRYEAMGDKEAQDAAGAEVKENANQDPLDIDEEAEKALDTKEDLTDGELTGDQDDAGESDMEMCPHCAGILEEGHDCPEGKQAQDSGDEPEWSK